MTSELRRLQLGHEGVRLVLCSKINEAEDLFKKTRFVILCILACSHLLIFTVKQIYILYNRFKGPQLHAGYSSVIFLVSIAGINYLSYK